MKVNEEEKNKLLEMFEKAFNCESIEKITITIKPNTSSNYKDKK